VEPRSEDAEVLAGVPLRSRGKQSPARMLLMLLTVLATIGILGWLIYRQREVLLTRQWTVNVPYLLLSFLLYCLIVLMTTAVWSAIMKSFGHKVRYAQHFRALTISALGKRLPGTIWFVAWRINYYRAEKISGKLVSLASGVELAVSVLSAIVISGVFAYDILRQYVLGIWGILALLLICLAVVHPRVIRWTLSKFKLDAVTLAYRDIIAWVGVYVFVRLCVGILYFLTANIFVHVPLERLPFIIGSCGLVAALSTFLFFFPSNFGFAEISYSLLFSTWMPSSMAVIVVLANRILVTLYDIILGGISFVWELSEKKRADRLNHLAK
jgi:uncharacterized membrane protein YbhN (UPF0104 family)